MTSRRGGRRNGAGRPPERLESLFEIFKAVEAWRSQSRRRVSVSEACQQIARRGGLKWEWVDPVSRQTVSKPLTNWKVIRNK